MLGVGVGGLGVSVGLFQPTKESDLARFVSETRFSTVLCLGNNAPMLINTNATSSTEAIIPRTRTAISVHNSPRGSSAKSGSPPHYIGGLIDPVPNMIGVRGVNDMPP